MLPWRDARSAAAQSRGTTSASWSSYMARWRWTSGSHHTSEWASALAAAASRMDRALCRWPVRPSRSASRESQYGIRANDPSERRLPIPAASG